jgi:hypothetical protein
LVPTRGAATTRLEEGLLHLRDSGYWGTDWLLEAQMQVHLRALGVFDGLTQNEEDALYSAELIRRGLAWRTEFGLERQAKERFGVVYDHFRDDSVRSTARKKNFELQEMLSRRHTRRRLKAVVFCVTMSSACDMPADKITDRDDFLRVDAQQLLRFPWFAQFVDGDCVPGRRGKASEIIDVLIDLLRRGVCVVPGVDVRSKESRWHRH